jgi:hypothetical protein
VPKPIASVPVQNGVHDLNGLRFDHLPALGARFAQGLQVANRAFGQKPVGKLLLADIGSVKRLDFGSGRFGGLPPLGLA